MLLSVRRKLFWFLTNNKVAPLECSIASHDHHHKGATGLRAPAGGFNDKSAPPGRKGGCCGCGGLAMWGAAAPRLVRGRKRKVTLVLMGLDNGGKTSLLAKIRGEAPGPTVPTWGFISKDIPHGRFKVSVYDLGGGKNIRRIWSRYLAEVHGAIFVVDSADSNRFSEAREALSTALRDPHLAHKPLLILANKQDLPDSIPPLEVSAALELSALGADDVRTFGASAVVKMEAEKQAVAERRARASISRMEREKREMDADYQSSAHDKHAPNQHELPSHSPRGAANKVEETTKESTSGRFDAGMFAEETEARRQLNLINGESMEKSTSCSTEQSAAVSTSYSDSTCHGRDNVTTRGGLLGKHADCPLECSMVRITGPDSSESHCKQTATTWTATTTPVPQNGERNSQDELDRALSQNCR